MHCITGDENINHGIELTLFIGESQDRELKPQQLMIELTSHGLANQTGAEGAGNFCAAVCDGLEKKLKLDHYSIDHKEKRPKKCRILFTAPLSMNLSDSGYDGNLEDFYAPLREAIVTLGKEAVEENSSFLKEQEAKNTAQMFERIMRVLDGHEEEKVGDIKAALAGEIMAAVNLVRKKGQ